MANQQGGGRDQDQGQGNWLPWNPSGHQREEDQARQEPGQGPGHQGLWALDHQGQGHQDQWGPGHQGQDDQDQWGPGYQGQDDQDQWGPGYQGQDDQGQWGPGYQGQGPQDQWLLDHQGQDDQVPWVPDHQGQDNQDRQDGEYVEDANEMRQRYYRSLDLPDTPDWIDLTVPQVTDILNAPLQMRMGPIILTLIIPELFKKFNVTVSVVGEELRIDLPAHFPQQMFQLLWGRMVGRLWLNRNAIWAIARATTSITLVFAHGKTPKGRSVLVLIPQNDTDHGERLRLSQFARSLCGWVFPDQHQLLHFNPKANLQSYVWLMDQATGRAPAEMYVPDEEVDVAQYAYDTALHYFYRRTRDGVVRISLHKHIKYELKKVLTIVAHRLLTRLAICKNRITEQNKKCTHPDEQRSGDYEARGIAADFVTYRDCLTEYGAFFPRPHNVEWDDPKLNNDYLRPLLVPDEPTGWFPTHNPIDPRGYVRTVDGRQVEVTDSIDYPNSRVFENHPVRIYQSLFGQWSKVYSITYNEDHMIVHSYADQRPNCAAQAPFKSNFAYSHIQFVRYCTVGQPGYSFSVHPRGQRWGYAHFECDMQIEIEMIRDLTLRHMRRTLALLEMTGEQQEDHKIGDMIQLLFPNDQTRWQEPMYWYVHCEDQLEIRKNYRALACRLVNKLAIRLVASAKPDVGSLNFNDPMVRDRWTAYWHGRMDILLHSPQQSHLPHLSQRNRVHRVIYRWLYALFDAPNRA